MLGLIRLLPPCFGPPNPFEWRCPGELIVQPVRRCITHLLPVRPTRVGRTDLTSQGAPRSVSFGEPCDRQRVCQPSSYHLTPRGSPPGVYRFSALFRTVLTLSTPLSASSRYAPE